MGKGDPEGGRPDHSEWVLKLAKIGLTEWQMAFVIGCDYSEIEGRYVQLIDDNLPPDYMKRRWKRFARFDPVAASEMRRLWRRTFGKTPVARVKASINSQMHVRYRGAGVGWTGRPWAHLEYTPEDLVSHLESQFSEGMTWDNYGTWWEIDHKAPVSWFKVKSIGDRAFNKCWALANLQPLLKRANRSKSNRYAHG